MSFRDGDGTKNPYSPPDAIYAAANYLHASGAPGDWQGAIFAYNHSSSYVATVLAKAAQYAGNLPGGAAATPAADPGSCSTSAPMLSGPIGGIEKVSRGGALAPIPGFPGWRSTTGSCPTPST